jgi:uncharacterized membrane protein YkvA (DUF1232 family)
MPLTITFELSDRDLRDLKKRAVQSVRAFDPADEDRIIDSVRSMLGTLESASAPQFVRERSTKLAKLLDMLEDERWQLAGEDRRRVLKAVAYVAEPQDLIPDTIPGLGYLDDAILVELVVRELRHEIEAYDDFCRECRRRPARGAGGKASREAWLAMRRKQLQERMRRRLRRRERMPSGTRSATRSPFSLW